MQPTDRIHDMSQFMTDVPEHSHSASHSMVQSPVPPPPAATFKKSKWTPDEDKLLVEGVKQHGMGNWSLVAQNIPGRTGKQCRERWINQLSPTLNKDNWSAQEDAILVQQQRLHGNVWSKIAQFLPGRSANSVKNRWSWLSRHRVPPSLAAQMMPFVVQQHKQQEAQRMPPMPQIFHTPMQTAPTERMWPEQLPQQSGRFAFSDPLEMIDERQLSADVDLVEMPMVLDEMPPQSLTPDVFLPFNDDGSLGVDGQRRLDDWSEF